MALVTRLSASRLSAVWRVPSVTAATIRPLSTAPVFLKKEQQRTLGLPVRKRNRLVGTLFGMFKKDSNLTLASYLINAFSSCSEGSKVAEFMDVFRMPDTFFSWFLVTELHLWMLSVRIMAEGVEESFEARDVLIEMFWTDCEKRAKELGPIKSSLRQQDLQSLGQELQAAFLIYDDGLSGGDKGLANAVWRRFFGFQEPDAERIDLLVRYIRRTMSDLDNIDIKELLQRKTPISWPPLELCVNGRH